MVDFVEVGYRRELKQTVEDLSNCVRICQRAGRTLVTPALSIVDTKATGRGVMAQVIILYRGPLSGKESTSISLNGVEA